MKKELKDYLHLYLGCGLQVLATQEIVLFDEICLNHKYPVWSTQHGYLYSEIKPMLRPLSDMTDHEAVDYMLITNPKTKANDVRRKGCIEYIQETGLLPQEFVWALSKYFDLFGLIEAGLAIDKTTL